MLVKNFIIFLFSTFLLNVFFVNAVVICVLIKIIVCSISSVKNEKISGDIFE